MKAHFALALENLKDMLAESAALAEDAVHAAIASVAANTPDAARAIIDNDEKLDSAEIAIEEECLKILALYQPVASDLRQVITILKVNNEIERIGDLAVNIASRVADMALYQDRVIEKFDFGDMVSRGCEMLRLALDALATHDVVSATDVIRRDDAVDALHRANYGKVGAAIGRHPGEVAYYMDCLTVSRCLERIADIATNIAEDVIYLESGRIVRHTPQEGTDRR